MYNKNIIQQDNNAKYKALRAAIKKHNQRSNHLNSRYSKN